MFTLNSRKKINLTLLTLVVALLVFVPTIFLEAVLKLKKVLIGEASDASLLSESSFRSSWYIARSLLIIGDDYSATQMFAQPPTDAATRQIFSSRPSARRLLIVSENGS